MNVIEFLKVIFLGIVEGITEWLPISSTGHMILVDEFIKLSASDAFKEVFFVVIQLGAIFAVLLLYWRKLLPLNFDDGKVSIDKPTIDLWIKIIVACIPAAIVGLLFDDLIDELFYNPTMVSIALIVFGVAFILVENRNKDSRPRVNSLERLNYRAALVIGLFQLIAAVFPGTSRSGATILGGIMIGVSRTVAAEFTFFLAIPVMFGASLLKLIKVGIFFTGIELSYLLLGMLVAFVVSVIVIKFLMNYIKGHDFKVFGWYRIILGVIVLGYFMFI
ncbi:MAG: undecaprenyl-diphosphate phosphatase [Erysipelotrichaceae bacterium]|nr:undecaprenyl-diphosphate phosphatase [Erysipelotrichaceae bacterium]